MGIKEAKLRFIISVARTLFFEKGIAAITIKDIARECGIGEATVYRYFTKKQNIVIAVAMSILEDVSGNYFHTSQYETGLEKIEAFYNSFYQIYLDHPEFYKFVSDFDIYTLENPLDLDQYETAIVAYNEEFRHAYELGVKDGSIKKLENGERFYLTTTHALLELCKKLASNAKILRQDGKYTSEEVKTLIKIYIRVLQQD